MRILADSHSIAWYLTTPEQLSAHALDALREAEDTEGIAVSVVTLGELWYATHKRPPRHLDPSSFALIEATLQSPEANADLVPVTESTIQHFGKPQLKDLKDPFDRFILSTAADLRLPLVSADHAIQKTGLVEVIW